MNMNNENIWKTVRSDALHQIFARIVDMYADRRVKEIGALKVLVYLYCNMFKCTEDVYILDIFNTLCRESGVSSSPGIRWKDVNSMGEKFVAKCSKENRCEIESLLRGSTPLCDRIDRRVKGVHIRKERKRLEKEQRRMTVDEEGWWYIPMKRRWRELSEDVKCIVWGVSEKSCTEADVKRECMRLGLDGLKIGVVRVGRDGGRRVEIVFASVAERERCIELLKEKFMDMHGWRVVRGRDFGDREATRRDRGGSSVVEVAMANYYHILKCMQEEEEVGLEASETVLKERARRGLEEEANKTEERVSGKDLGASETVLQERARGGKKKVAKKTESRARRKGKKHTEDVLHSEKGPRGKANVQDSPVLRVGTWNVNGIGNKWDPLVQVVDRSDIDILGVTEHHMRETDKHKMGPNSKFVWFGKVSKEIAAGSKKGSQGVGFLVHSRVVDMVSIVDCGE
jgi:hypothetical protein